MKKPKPKPTKTRRPSVRCPSCGHEFSDVERTAAPFGGSITRVRRCLSCRKTFRTVQPVERAAGTSDLLPVADAAATSIAGLMKVLRLTPDDLPPMSMTHLP